MAATAGRRPVEDAAWLAVGADFPVQADAVSPDWMVATVTAAQASARRVVAAVPGADVASWRSRSGLRQVRVLLLQSADAAGVTRTERAGDLLLVWLSADWRAVAGSPGARTRLLDRALGSVVDGVLGVVVSG